VVIESLRVRDFRLLWVGNLVSQLGSWLLVVAVPAHVFILTGSVAATGLTLAAQFLPPAVLGPVAGALVDRWDRRTVMIIADLARAAAVTLLLFARGPADLWLVYVALVAESAGTVVFRPAAQAHIPAVVGSASGLSSANAMNAVVDGAVRLIGAPLGGVLLAALGFPALVGLDTATYVLSAACILRSAAVTRTVRPGRTELRGGWAFLRSHRTARTLVLINTVFLAVNACLSALLVPYGLTVLGGSAQTGLLMSALGIGFLLGAPLLKLLVDRIAIAYLLTGTLAVTGTGFAALFTATTLGAALPAAGVIGAAGSMTLGGTQTTLQRVAPRDVLGRTLAALFTGEAIATVAGAVAGPAVAQAISITGTAVAAGAAVLLTAVVAGALLPRIRTPG
jgi:MFS family permease